MKRLYWIRDVVAQAFLGGPVVLPVDAVAVRFFGDVAGNPETQVSRHLDDHELWCVGSVSEEGVIAPESRVIITGASWRAAQLPAEPQLRVG